MPLGVSTINIKEQIRNGFEWMGIDIIPVKPDSQSQHPSVAHSLSEIKNLIDETNSEYKGVYEQFDGSQGYQIAFIEKDNKYYLIFLEGNREVSNWNLGDVKAELRQTAVANMFMASWYMLNKQTRENAKIIFEPGFLNVQIGNNKTETFIKMSTPEEDLIPIDGILTDNTNGVTKPLDCWTGTGFALNNGYIVTNNHVTDNAKNIVVHGIKGDYNKSYKAEVVGRDKINDLSLLKIKDESFNGFGMICLLNLIESVADPKIIPSSNSTNGLALIDQVKKISPFVFYIKCFK